MLKKSIITVGVLVGTFQAGVVPAAAQSIWGTHHPVTHSVLATLLAVFGL